MSNDLLKQIDDLVASKTFNLDALDGIKSLKDSLKETLEERASLQRKYEGLYETSNKQSEEIQRLTGVVGELKEKVAQLKAGELKAREAVWEKLIADAKADAYQDALYTVFKPSAVRETIQRSVAVPVAGHPGGNGMSPSAGWVSRSDEAETITKEQL